jgi:hypothetical protein
VKVVISQVFANWWILLNCGLRSSSERGVNPGIRGWKSTHLIEFDVRLLESHSWYLSPEEVKSWNLTIWFRIGQSQTRRL